MKLWMMMVSVAGVALLGCSDTPNFPEECNDIIKMAKEMGKDAPAGQMEQFDKQVEEAREKWKDLSEEEREQAKNQCVTAKSQMEQLKAMLDTMK